jgi:hypothetical protein
VAKKITWAQPGEIMTALREVIERKGTFCALYGVLPASSGTERT